MSISYAVFCLKKKKKEIRNPGPEGGTRKSKEQLSACCCAAAEIGKLVCSYHRFAWTGLELSNGRGKVIIRNSKTERHSSFGFRVSGFFRSSGFGCRPLHSFF